MALAGVMLCASQHVAAAETCTDPRISVQGELDPRWLAPVIDLCETLRALPDLDPEAKLRLVPRGPDIVVEVRLADGRVALRRVGSPEELRGTVEALMTILPSPPTEPPRSQGAQVEPEAARATGAASEQMQRGQVAIAFEWATVAAGRVAGNPTYLSVGPAGHVGLRAGEWLLALSLRWDAHQIVADSPERTFEMDTVAAGFGVSRRLVGMSSFRLDLGPDVLLVNEAQSVESAEGEQAGSEADLRVGVVLRSWFGTPSLRFVTQLDAEVSPTRLRRDIRMDASLPTLPAWSAGVGVGLGWAPP